MKNKNQNLIIAIFTIFVIIVWIASNLHHIAISSTIPEEIKQVITPFDPTIDEKIFEMIKQKKGVNDFSVGVTENKQATNSAELK